MVDKTLKNGTRRVMVFRQEDPIKYCGPAVAKMILRWHGVNQSQDDLWDLIQEAAEQYGWKKCDKCPNVECAVWHSAPEALHHVLREQSGVLFKLVTTNVGAAADHAIVWSVLQGVPASALVKGRAHWVVVDGYQVDREPTAIGDTGYQLFGVHLIDPNKKVKARQYLPAGRWRTEYFYAVPCGRFEGKFVAVCDPEPPLPARGPSVPMRRPSRPAISGQFLSPARVAQVATDGLRNAGLWKHAVWAAALERATPGTPRLVHRLDRPRSFYYIVPFSKGPGVTVQALVDPSSGLFLEARVTDDLKQPLPTPWTVEDAVSLIVNRRIDLPGVGEHVRLRPEGITPSSTLVWKLCEESHSFYDVFVRLSYADATLYVRSDGAVFTKLTDSRSGG